MKILVYTFYVLAGISACLGVVIMTDIGQLMGINKSWIVWYFENSIYIMGLSLAFLILAIYLSKKHSNQKTTWKVVFSLI